MALGDARTEITVSAGFYRTLMKTLEDLDLPVTINTTPNEIENRSRWIENEEHRSYDREYGIGSGTFSCKAIVCLRNSGHVFVESAVRCIFSGAALISR